MTNDHHFSDPNWGGQTPGPNGTSWLTNDAATGKRENARKRHGVRAIERQHQFGVPSPLDTAAVDAFVAAYEAAERDKPHLLSELVGGVVGYQLAKRYVRNRRASR